MDLGRVLEIAEKANAFINDMRRKANNVINKINSCLKDLENLAMNAARNSAAYVKEKMKNTIEKIEGMIESLKNMINNFKRDLQDWYNTQVYKLKFNMVKAQQTKLGLETSDEQIRRLAEEIPHPELPIPEFKIELPEISLNLNVNTSFSFTSIPNV